jgi:hypothetical protein
VNERYLELAERIRTQIPDLERAAQRALRAWSHLQQHPGEQDAYVDSVALNLHGFYSGVERLFELVARHVDGTIPNGETWHRDLVRRMTEDRPRLRPAVIGSQSALALDELRRFRHLVRSVYTFNLAPERMASLIAALPELWAGVRAELLAFADYLEDLARASGA